MNRRLARQFLAKKVNSVVQVHTPAGELSYQILEVK